MMIKLATLLILGFVDITFKKWVDLIILKNKNVNLKEEDITLTQSRSRTTLPKTLMEIHL